MNENKELKRIFLECFQDCDYLEASAIQEYNKRMGFNEYPLRMSSRKLKEWREIDSEFDEEITQLIELDKDSFERRFKQLALKGETPLILHYAKTRLSSRGYGEAVDIPTTKDYTKQSSSQLDDAIQKAEKLMTETLSKIQRKNT